MTGGGVGVVICADVCSGLTIIKIDAAKTRTNMNIRRLSMLFYPIILGCLRD